MKSLVAHPDLGRVRDDVRIGLRGLLVGEHIVYYRIAEDVIRVMRILHQARDAAAAFAQDDES